jgi:vacuolar-type H+-ATPase subunit H
LKVYPTPFSPLDQIRQAEAENIRKIAAARESAEQVVVKARLDADLLKKQALEEGNREGQARYREILLRREEEAKALVVQAHSTAEKLRRKGEASMDIAVRSAVELIIGLEGGTESPDEY